MIHMNFKVVQNHTNLEKLNALESIFDMDAILSIIFLAASLYINETFIMKHFFNMARKYTVHAFARDDNVVYFINPIVLGIDNITSSKTCFV